MDSNTRPKLISKVFITGTLVVETGLRIGAGKNDFDLGSPELAIVRTNGAPFIPGSSLKGKLRSLLGKVTGRVSVEKDVDKVKRIFGDSGSNDKLDFVTRLLVRDCLEIKATTETKTENTIKRLSGTAINPREVERIAAGSQFTINLVLDEYKEDDLTENLQFINFAFNLLKDDYLGGNGSRGYGKVSFKGMEVSKRPITEAGYEEVSKFDYQWV